MLAQALLERGRARDRREAFLVLDALRARTLREEIERQAPALFDPPGVRAMRERLEQLWRALERRDGEPGNLRRIEDPLLREVGRHERALVRALEQEPAAAGTPLVQELPRDPCLAYSVLGSEVVGLFARAGEVQAWSCGRLSRLRSEQASFRFQVRRRLHGSSEPGPALACLERIAARLLPTGTSWRGVRRLTVVLPPELGALPVEALPAGGRPLLSRCTVVHAPGATLPRRARKKLRAPLVVGIEDRALPEVRRELNSVLRRLPDAAVLRGSAATRDAVLQALARRRLVHIAGHARAREDVPPLSALRVRDGWIAAADLRDRRLDGALVVLSACRTGDPSLLWNGEAMGGFPRTLLAAGASTLIASRWEIPDDIAHAWMRGFYRRLETDGPEAALNGAARTMLRHHPHPADWCAFLCIRNPG